MQNSTENGEEIIKKEWQNELENPEITEQDYFKKNPSIQSFLEKYYKGKELEKKQFIESNIKTSIEEFRLSYKYLQNKIGARDLIHTFPYHYLRENTTEEDVLNLLKLKGDEVGDLSFERIKRKRVRDTDELLRCL